MDRTRALEKTACITAFFLVILLAAPGYGASAPAAAPASAGAFEVRGGEIYDAQGRIANFRGVNIAGNAKLAPDHLPFQPEETGWWDRLEEWGFNLARFCVFWEGIEPEKGVFDEAYLDRVERLLDGAAQRGIYVMVDMHQDIFSRFLGGDGAPRWAVEAAGVDPDSNNGFGGPLWSWSNVFSSDLRKCITNFWRSDELKAHYRDALVEVARRVADNPYVLGYDIMNEPGAGEIDNAGGAFENGYLKPFYEFVIAALRQVDPDAIGFVEPLDWLGSQLNPFANDRLVYAPHMYDTIANSFRVMILPEYILFQLFHGIERNKARELGMPLLVGEFGAPWYVNPPGARDEIVDAQYRAMESGFTSNALWDYSVRDVTCWNEEDFSLIDEQGNPRGLAAAARPYARRLSGTPVRQSFDRATRRYELEFRGASVTAPTVVHVPVSVQYPEGFRVSVSDGRYSFNASTGELLYRCRRGTRSHTIVIVPEG